jgi:HD-GYP domain-containing protein (c-di-GMP phosphodiesterase class II)
MDPANLQDSYVQVPVHRLEQGMYVAMLDRPWLETPFVMQGFAIQGDDDILTLAQHCDVVYVDPRRAHTVTAAPSIDASHRRLREDFSAAKVSFESAGAAVRRVFKQLRTQGALDLVAVKHAVSPLIKSVMQHQDALAALARMKTKDDYLFNHSIATAVWAALIGRQVGLDRALLTSLAVGAAVLDVGKVKLPEALLGKSGLLNAEERALMCRHVEFGLELARSSGLDDPVVMQVMGMHHERFNGQGYPGGITAQETPLVAQIAGLADSYDAMLTPRPYAAPHTSFTAVQELLDLQDIAFSKPLVEQFVQAVGLFPTGCLVELNTGEVGIVVAQNPARRLRPKIMLVLDAQHQPPADLVTLDLMKYSAGGADAGALWIVKELEQGAYGISAAEFFL